MPNITFRRNSVISATYLLRTKTLGNTFKLRAPSWLLPFAPKKSAAWELTELNRVFSQQFLWNQIKPQTIWFSGWVSTQKNKKEFCARSLIFSKPNCIDIRSAVRCPWLHTIEVKSSCRRGGASLQCLFLIRQKLVTDTISLNFATRKKQSSIWTLSSSNEWSERHRNWTC